MGCGIGTEVFLGLQPVAKGCDLNICCNSPCLVEDSGSQQSFSKPQSKGLGVSLHRNYFLPSVSSAYFRCVAARQGLPGLCACNPGILAKVEDCYLTNLMK